MVARKNPRFPKRKNLPDWAKAIHELYHLLGCGTQEEFAARVGAKQGTVSTWLRGDETRRPSADTLVRMAGLAPEPDLAGRFLRLVNISDDTVFSVARKLKMDRFREAATLVQKGEVVLVPRYRYTVHGKEEAGPPVPMPAEFIPSVDSTICLLVDYESSTSVRESPRGLYILNSSCEGTEDLERLWGAVIAVDYQPKSGDPSEWGVYIGRLNLRMPSPVLYWRHLVWHADLELLLDGRKLPLGTWQHPGAKNSQYSRGSQQQTDLTDVELTGNLRARRELRLQKGIEILGKIIGRLTGHLK
jgi:transcriptional regulator with XRE-family HTH domain